MRSFQLTIVTPAGKRFDGEAESVVAPGEEGVFGVLAYHAPMIAGLRPGVLTVRAGGVSSFFVMGQGVLEVSAGNSVVVLADAAEPAASREEAEKELAG